MENIKAWAVINWSRTAIVNDGMGQKRIYRTKEDAKEARTQIGCGTKVVAVLITELKNENKKKIQRA